MHVPAIGNSVMAILSSTRTQSCESTLSTSELLSIAKKWMKGTTCSIRWAIDKFVWFAEVLPRQDQEYRELSPSELNSRFHAGIIAAAGIPNNILVHTRIE